MNLKRLGVLVTKELMSNARNFISVYIIVAPIALSLIVALVFGEGISEKPHLGYVDEGDSQFVSLIAGIDFVQSKAYSSTGELTKAVERGAIDIGIVVPQDFDTNLAKGDEVQLNLLVWGESVLKDQVILSSTLRDLVATMIDRETSIRIEPVMLGDASTLTIQERLLPMLVLMSVVLGGTMIPALSLVEEKQNRTLKALVITPASLEDVYLAKGVFGVIVSLLMATIILVMNQALGTQMVTLLAVLLIGAVAAAAFGLMFASFVKDVTTLMAIIKATGLLLYAPGLLHIFPEVPTWISRIFPTYYLIGPVITVTQEGGSWSEVTGDLAVLIVIMLALIAGAVMAARRSQYQPT